MEFDNINTSKDLLNFNQINMVKREPFEPRHFAVMITHDPQKKETGGKSMVKHFLNQGQLSVAHDKTEEV